MKATIFFIALLHFYAAGYAQMTIHDQAIVNQQERMVFKSWDADKFTPKPGFLSLNPLYWITWGLHPNYPDTDIRPLGPLGPQTMRSGMLIAMRLTDDAYKLHTDTLRNSAISAYSAQSGLLSDFDPLWKIYYSKALSNLDSPPSPLSGVNGASEKYLKDTGLVDWYTEQHQGLRERLQLARTADMERGSRIILYHRLLTEYRKLQAGWEDKKIRAAGYLKLKLQKEKISRRVSSINSGRSSDIEIADRILKNSKL